MIMEKRNITMQIKEMANFIMYVLVEFVFSDSYLYFDLNLSAIIIPEALKSLYRSPGYKKNQLVLCKNYVLQW